MTKTQTKTHHHDDPQEAFEHAIFERVLSEHPAAPTYAGRYMYMYSTARYDYFKHIQTREYVRSPLVS